MRNLLVVHLLLAVGLAACGGETTETPAAESTSGDETRAAVDAPLDGFWAEFWAPGGEAETDRHLFLPDGRWGFVPSAKVEPSAAPRSGTWSIDAGALVLQVEGQEAERLELGECPPNEEAQELDQNYACRSLGGRAFWRYAGPDGADQAAFLP